MFAGVYVYHILFIITHFEKVGLDFFCLIEY